MSRSKFVKFLVLLVLADQLIKFGVRRISWFSLNQGVAFGWGSLVDWRVISVLLISLVLVNFKKSLGLALILSGGLSNLIDRFVFGGAIDYLNFFNMFVFNFSDLMVVGGCFLLIYKYGSKKDF